MTKPTLYKDNSKSNNFFETMQAIMANRLAKPFGGNDPIVYEFTNDRGMLHQYYRLRETMYRKIFHTDEFNGQEDVHDKIGHVLIARRGKLCLGGCRLTIREADEMWDMPMETNGFVLRNVFPELPLNSFKHGEISRFAIMEDTGSDENIFYGLCKVMYDKVINEQIHYLFAKSTLTLARNWRLIANSFDVKTTKIRNDIEVPENPIHPDVKWYITVSQLSDIFNRAADATSDIDKTKTSQQSGLPPVDKMPQLQLVE